MKSSLIDRATQGDGALSPEKHQEVERIKSLEEERILKIGALRHQKLIQAFYGAKKSLPVLLKQMEELEKLWVIKNG